MELTGLKERRNVCSLTRSQVWFITSVIRRPHLINTIKGIIRTVRLTDGSSSRASLYECAWLLFFQLCLGSRLRERWREADSFTALALHSFSHSVIQSQIGPLSSTDSHSYSSTGSHFGFLLFLFWGVRVEGGGWGVAEGVAFVCFLCKASWEKNINGI